MSGNLGPILFFCAAVGVGICSIMAYYGFQGRINTIGVDLGTTLSVVGYKSRSKVTIVTDKNGNCLFPSIVSYGDDGQIYTLHEAFNRLEDYPRDTIFNAKRFIGRSLDEDVVKLYAEHHPFQGNSFADNFNLVIYSFVHLSG
jgi:molecular chaperone DnaK (HSP70)